MKRFIDHNHELRNRATDQFTKSYYKLMNNSVYGKCMENVRRRVDIRFATSDSQFLALSRKANFLDRTVVAEGVVAVHLRRNRVLLDKPIYVGTAVLDISKVHMYNFHYNIMTRHLTSLSQPVKLYLLYSDTDSLVYLIVTRLPLNAILKDLTDHLDTSCYPAGHELRREGAMSIIGTFKDESKGRALYEYVALRCKMYAFRYNSDQQKDATKKAKGIKLSFVQNKMSFEQYKKALFSGRTYRANFNQIRCRRFHLTTEQVSKISLNANDDKRVTLACNIRTLPYGHYELTAGSERHSNSSDDSSCSL